MVNSHQLVSYKVKIIEVIRRIKLTGSETNMSPFHCNVFFLFFFCCCCCFAKSSDSKVVVQDEIYFLLSIHSLFPQLVIRI